MDNNVIYDPVNGTVNSTTWNDRGYRVFWHNGKSMRVHRYAFLQMKGYIPDDIDHIDRNKSNNKWGNLRETTRSQNCRNSQKNKRMSKYIGVYPLNNKTGGKTYRYFVGAISIEGKRIRTKRHKCDTAAAIARDKLILSYKDNYSITNLIRRTL